MKLKGHLSTRNTPFRIPGNRITEGNMTITTPPDHPQKTSDQFLLGNLMVYGRMIRKPLTVDFLKVREALPSDNLRSQNLLPILQRLYGEQFELKTREELIRDVEDEFKKQKEQKPRLDPGTRSKRT